MLVVFPGFFAVLMFGALVTSIRLSHLIFRELRNNYLVTWEEMGSPRNIFASRRTYWELDKFCFSGNYLSLGSSRLNKLCNWLTLCRIILVCGFLLCLASGRHAGH